MQITLNGTSKILEAGTTLHDLINQIQLKHQQFAIAVNQQLVPKSKHIHYIIKEQDSIEIVVPHQGG